MKGVKNLKVLGASLCLSAVLLTGCGEERILVGKSEIVCEEGKTIGNISYEDVDKYLRIVTFEQDGKASCFLLISTFRQFNYGKGYYDNCKQHAYYDLKTGACILDYYDYYNLGEFQYKIGEGINIVEEKTITPYLISENFIQKEYTVEEILNFFNDKVLPTLENNEKELVK